ncbi:PhzF family phenazine biosynthesis protein [Frigoribacterium sp. PvP054]|uniref:PhzF family phenazine biosynthesis protein n=1 Tax=Frigoribacterium sp. PvP054 TaxID=3156438 RepID=UPI0033947852
MTDRRPAPEPLPSDGPSSSAPSADPSSSAPSADPSSSAPSADVLHLTAFAVGPGGGNPAGVVLDASALTAVDMLRVAAEVGHAETAFVVDASVAGDDRRVAVRYFSPGAEVPFCGHATIATAVALAERRGVGAFTLDTAVGPVVIETARGDGSGDVVRGPVTASFTSVEPVVRDLDPAVTDRLLALLGLGRTDLDDRRPLRESFAGNRHPVVAVREQRVFDGFGFDPAALRALMDEQGWAGTVTVFCDQGVDESGATVVEARNLFPVGSITEDPATGSAAASLGGYLRALDLIAPPARVVVRQGRHVGRPSLLVVDVPVTGGITVTGTATPLPDAPAR